MKKIDVEDAICNLKRIKKNPNGLAEEVIQKLFNESTNNETFHDAFKGFNSRISVYGDIWIKTSKPYSTAMSLDKLSTICGRCTEIKRRN